MAFTPVQKASIGTGVALGVLALVGFVAYLSITQMIGSLQAVASTNANIGRLDRVVARTVDGENAQRGFVSTGDTAYLEPLGAAQSDVEFALDSLRAATEDNPAQRRDLDKLAPMIATRFREIRASVAMRQRFGADSAKKILHQEKAVRTSEGAGPLANRMRDQELRVLGERTRAMTVRGRTASNFIFIASLLALILAFVALQPLRPAVAARLQRRLSVPWTSSSALQLTGSEEARHAGDRLTRLQQVIAALSHPVSASDTAQALLTRGAPPLVGSLGVVATFEGGNLRVLRALGDVVKHLAPGSAIPASLMDPFAEAVRTRAPVVVASRIERMRRFASMGRFSETGTSDGAFVAAPLMADETVLGVLLIAFADNREFSDDERAYLRTLGRIGGQALARTASESRP
ncbi:MAG TPA: CHASE3 domain-containing protein [Gemmatimonadaceae bacterium]|nr:CHASE3 domain-containing protein [Gemmatimonadaceae bacterium]